ncbi:GapA-binding peptide SR1P [Bacillus sp. OTU530]
MGTTICQVCEGTIEQFEDEKVTMLYGNFCSHCIPKNKENVER